jgi:FixJ family two-component response regulator
MGVCALYKGCAPSASERLWCLAPDAEPDGLRPAGSPMAVASNWAGCPLYRPRDKLAMLHRGLAKLMHVDEEHVVEQPPIVIVVDDDPGVRDSLGKLLRSAGFRVSLLGSVSEFLKADCPEGPACLVLDVRLPGQSGLELQRELAGAKRQLPIIFITGHGDIPMSVQAMKGGAIEFLTKPFREQALLDAIQLGHARDQARLEQERAMAELNVRFETLTPREREVMALVVTGRLNKQIAADLGVSEITVKVHRGQVMRKMRASSLPDLARMADQLQLKPTKPHSPGRVA